MQDRLERYSYALLGGEGEAIQLSKMNRTKEESEDFIIQMSGVRMRRRGYAIDLEGSSSTEWKLRLYRIGYAVARLYKDRNTGKINRNEIFHRFSEYEILRKRLEGSLLSVGSSFPVSFFLSIMISFNRQHKNSSLGSPDRCRKLSPFRIFLIGFHRLTLLVSLSSLSLSLAEE